MATNATATAPGRRAQTAKQTAAKQLEPQRAQFRDRTWASSSKFRTDVQHHWLTTRESVRLKIGSVPFEQKRNFLMADVDEFATWARPRIRDSVNERLD